MPAILDISVLSQAEQKVYAFYIQGLPSEETANRLYLSKRTVDSHCRAILKKLGYVNRLQLMVALCQQLKEQARDVAAVGD